MKYSAKSYLVATGLVLAFLAGPANFRTTARDKNKDSSKDKSDSSSQSSSKSSGSATQRGGHEPGYPTDPSSHSGNTKPPYGGGGSSSSASQPGTRTDPRIPNLQDSRSSTRGDDHQSSHAEQDRQARGHGTVQSNLPGGGRQMTHYSANGVRETAVVQHPDGRKQTTTYGPDGKTPKQEVITHPDKTEQTKHYGSDGTLQKEVQIKPDKTEHTRNYGPDGKTLTDETIKHPDNTEQAKHYDKNGKLQKEVETRPDNTQQTKSYSADGNRVKQEVLTHPDGTQKTTHYSPTGRAEKEEFVGKDGSLKTTQYGLNGKPTREEVVNQDHSRAVTTYQAGRDGSPRVQETVHKNSQGVAVSKTVIVNQTSVIKNTTIIKNTTVINNRVERNYIVGRYGYVYEPRYVVYRPYIASWYDPFWYPGGVLVVHPFHFAWGWEAEPWYRCYYGPYWGTYEVYPTPAYWVTDWMVAGYVADHYAASVSAAQAHEEARLAHEEAQRATEAADHAADQAEIAEAKAAQAQAELRVKNAEERAARAERQEANVGKPNPNATPIDKETKEALKNQIEATIAEKKQLAEQSEKAGHPVLPDLSKTLADPNHVYPVSKTTSVTSAKDSSPAGTITEGDLLKLEPGQEEALKKADENTFVKMRVMSSKGEEGEVLAGTVISVPLKDVQEFDNEFRAKLDQGLADADQNKEKFKQPTEGKQPTEKL
ncbi:MAG: hypothetical protein C5B50_26020 [Verrucomicrobia bacterium]|nr:MAG: hypothetical protein C5B50_26020 [Verrucomicrobiota bacterium]